MEAAENIAVNITVMATMPGKMKVRKSKPGIGPVIRVSPVPSTNRNSTGCTSDVMMRRWLRENRISSRSHTTHIPRTSAREADQTGTGIGTVFAVMVIASTFARAPRPRRCHRCRCPGWCGRCGP